MANEAVDRIAALEARIVEMEEKRVKALERVADVTSEQGGLVSEQVDQIRKAIAEAEASGDLATARRLKGAWLDLLKA